MRNRAGFRFVATWACITFTLGFLWPMFKGMFEGGEKVAVKTTSPTPVPDSSSGTVEESETTSQQAQLKLL